MKNFDVVKDQILSYCLNIANAKNFTTEELDFIMQAVLLEITKAKYRELVIAMIQKDGKENTDNGDTK